MNTKCYMCLENEANKHKKEVIPVAGCKPQVSKLLQKRLLSEEQMRLLIYQVIDTMFCPSHELSYEQDMREREEYKLFGDLHEILQKLALHYETNYPVKIFKH